MHADLRGFYGAPVTYAASLAVGAASSASILFDYGRFFLVDRDLVLNRGQYWRLFAHQIGFDHGLAASLGLYVIFQFRVLERLMGSRKFGSMLFFVCVIIAALQLSLLHAAPSLIRRLPSGPYAHLGALTLFFLKFVPRLQPKAFSFLGVNLTDKSSTYLLLLVILGRNPRTLAQFLPGFFLGIVFSIWPFSKLQLPGFICSVLSIFHPFFDVVPASAVMQQRQRRVQEAQRRLGVRANQVQGQGARDQLLPNGMLPPAMAAAPPQPASEDAILQLVALGFDREQALAALRAADNNVEAAANRLLNAM